MIKQCESFLFQKNQTTVQLKYDTIISNLEYFDIFRKKCIDCMEKKSTSNDCKDVDQPVSLDKIENFSFLGDVSLDVLLRFSSIINETNKLDESLTVMDEISYPSIAYMMHYFIINPSEYKFYPTLNSLTIDDIFAIAKKQTSNSTFVFDPLFIESFQSNLFIMFNHSVLSKQYPNEISLRDLNVYINLLKNKDTLEVERKRIDKEITDAGFKLRYYESLTYEDLVKQGGTPKDFAIYNSNIETNNSILRNKESISEFESKYNLASLDEKEKDVWIEKKTNENKNYEKYLNFVRKSNMITILAVTRNPICLRMFLDLYIKKLGNYYFTLLDRYYEFKIKHRFYNEYNRERSYNDENLISDLFEESYNDSYDLSQLIKIIDIFVCRTLIHLNPETIRTYLKIIMEPKYYQIINRINHCIHEVYDSYNPDFDNRDAGIDDESLSKFWNLMVVMDSLLPDKFKFVCDGQDIMIPMIEVDEKFEIKNAEKIESFDVLELYNRYIYTVSLEDNFEFCRYVRVYKDVKHMYLTDIYFDALTYEKINKLYGIRKYTKIINRTYGDSKIGSMIIRALLEAESQK